MVRKKSAKKVQDAAEKVEKDEKKDDEFVLLVGKSTDLTKSSSGDINDATLVTSDEVLEIRSFSELGTAKIEPDVTPKLQSDAEALQELQQILNMRPQIPAAITSIKDGADFVTEYERWNRKADRINPR